MRKGDGSMVNIAVRTSNIESMISETYYNFESQSTDEDRGNLDPITCAIID